jgi:uncharacterized protein YjgD (DUF1641 family)
LNISYKIIDSVHKLTNDWDALLPHQHHLAKKYLAIVEDAKLENIFYQYVYVYDKEILIGVAYFQIFNFNYTHINFKKENCVRSKLVKWFLPKHLPLLICGNLFRINQQGFYFVTEEDNNLIFEVIKKIKNNLPKKPCGILLKDNSSPINESLIQKHQFNFFSSDVTMELKNNDWQSFDDYQKALSKKYRKRAAKILEHFNPIVIKELNAAEIIANKQIIEQLYWNVVNKQTIKLGTINVKYFYNLKNTLQDKFEFHGLYLDDKMVGFYTYIFYEKEMETHYIGLDYDVNHTHNTYFALLFLGAKKMIEKCCSSLELGRTAKEAKANLGAVPRQIYNYIYIKNKIANLSLLLILKRFNKEENNKQLNRNPFK